MILSHSINSNILMTFSPGLASVAVAFSGTMVGAGIGAAFTANLSRVKVGVLIALAAGMMAGCALVLLQECTARVGYGASIYSSLLGLLLMYSLDWICSNIFSEEKFEFTGLSGHKAVRVFVMLTSLIMHSIGEGLSLGLSAADSSSTSAIVSSSLALHNIPETVALLLSFRGKGLSQGSAILLAVFSNLPQSIVALPAFSFFASSSTLIEYGMGIAASCMGYAVIVDVFPEAVEAVPRGVALAIAALSALAVVVFDFYSHVHIR